MIGSPSDVMVAPTVTIVADPTEKLRLRKRTRGMSGSPRCTRCHTTNSARMTRPAAMSIQTVTGPQMRPHSKASPS